MRKRFWFLGFIFVLGLVVLARDALITKGAEIYVSRKMTSYGWSFESIQREKNSLKVQNLCYQNASGKTAAQDVHAEFHLSLFPLKLQPTVSISHLFLEVAADQSADDSLLGLFFCLGDPRIDLKLSIEEGMVTGILKEPFGFSFKPGQEKREVGTLSLQDLEKNVFLSTHLKWEGESLVSQVEINQGNASDLMTLTSMLQNSSFKGWTQGRGEVSASIRSRFHPRKGLEEMEGKLDLQEISFSHPDFGVELFSHSLQGTLLFSADALKEENLSFWKKVELFLTFEDTNLNVDQKDLKIGAQEVLGEIRLHPKEDPYLKMGGKILSKNLFIPFEVEGKGQLLDKGTYWVRTQADFFLSKTSPHLSISFVQNEEEKSTLEVQCIDLSHEVFNVLGLSFPLFKFPECQMQGGAFTGGFVGAFEKGASKTLTFSDCLAQNVAFSIPSQSLLMKSQNISFSGVLEQNDKGLLDVRSLVSEIRKVDLSLQGKEMLRSFSAKVGAELGEFTSSYAEGYCQGIWGSAQILDQAASHLLHVECKALSSDLMKKISNGDQVSQDPAHPVFLSLDVSRQEDKAYGSAVIRLISSSGVEEDIDVQVLLDRPISRNIRDLFSRWDLSSCQGAFKTDKLSSETGIFWIRPWLGSLAFQGFLRGEGQFNGKGISMDVSQADFELSDGCWGVSAKLGSEEKKIHLAYEYKEGLWKGTVPVDFLRLQNTQLKLEAEVQDSLFFFEGDQLWTDHWQADVEGSKLFGKLLMDKEGVHVSSKAFEGTLLSLRPVLNKVLPKTSFAGLNGLFSIEDRGCLIEGKKQGESWLWDFKLSASLKDIACDLGKMGKIHQGKCRIEGNAKGDFKLKELQGVYASKSATCPFALSDIHWSSDPDCSTDFSFLAKDGKREWMYVQGNLGKQRDGVLVSLSSHSHMLGVLMDVSPFTINSDFVCSPIQASSSLKLEQLPSYLKMWKEMGLPVINSSLVDACQGTLNVQAIYDVQKSAWKASLQSPEVSHAKNMIGKAQAVIQGEGNRIKVESCQVGPWSLKGSFDILPTEWSSSSLMLEWPEGKCLVKGKYTPSLNKLQIPAFSSVLASQKIGNIQLQGNFEGTYSQETSSFQGKGFSKLVATLPQSLGMSIESMKEVPFSFDSSKGIQIEKSQWELTTSNKQRLGKVSAKAMTYLMGEKRFTLQGGSLLCPKESYKALQNLSFLSKALKDVQIDQEIDLQADIDLSLQSRKISGTLKNGLYHVKGSPFDVKQMKFLLDQEELYASCQTKYQEEPLWLQLQMNLSKVPFACLLIKDHPEKKGLAVQLKSSLKDGWVCEAIQGTLKGTTLQMKKEAGKNIYDLQVSADLSQVPAFLPKGWATNMKKWGLGQGYAFQGSLVLDPVKSPFHVVSLKGDVSGENFEFLGKNFDAFTAKVDFTADKGRVHSLKLDDEVANLSIKTVDFAFNPKIKSWDITSPLVYVKDFAPALLLKGQKERGMEIKNLSLYELSGALNNLDSFEAKGALYFSSLEKKEFSFWDAPLGLMKDWGLDPGLLTPVTGEADFVLRRGCFYFTALRNVYSEGKRSQFYLAELGNDAYLSLDGNWHVDLSMKQNVVWKVTEDLVLSIRGTIEKPKYSFKSSKKPR